MEGLETPITTDNTKPPSTSLAARLTNVFAAPSEVFDEVKASPPTPANWIAPLVLSMIVGIIYTMIVFSQPAILQHMKDGQEKAMQKKVNAGKMTQKQADDAMEVAGKFMTPTVFKVVGILSSIVFNAVMLFLVAFVIWLIGRFALEGSFTYMKTVEVSGLSAMISVLGAIISMLLAVVYGDMSMTPGPVLFVGHFDPSNKLHLVLSALNVPILWYLGVMSIGLARLSGTGFWKPALWIFVIWYGVWAAFVLGLPMLLK